MKLKFFSLALLFLFFTSCSNDDDHRPSASVSVNDFVWKALNLWYFWQQDVPDLADDRFATDGEYRDFLSGKSPDDLFYSLLFDYGNVDRFSWIVPDYRDLDNSFAGINKTFGMSYGLVYYPNSTTDIFGYVQYIIPGSSAADAGMERGDIFTHIDGTRLNSSNYQSLLEQNSGVFRMGYLSGGEILDFGEEVTLFKTEIQENPVYLAQVIQEEDYRVGYIVYNNFRSNFNEELNQAVADLKSQGADKMILDLRYNGGGSVLTATYLGSMLTGQFTGDAFTKLTFNEKVSGNNRTYYFENKGKTYDDDLNETGSFDFSHLNLNSLYVITQGGTASASEMLINCLKPYIEVHTIGLPTYGKTVGSVTLYDSPKDYYTSAEHLNPDHTWAMQPIVFDYKNAQDQSGPLQGFTPEVSVNEIHYLEGLTDLGNPEEPLLKAALNLVTHHGKPLAPPDIEFKLHSRSQDLDRMGKEMYLDKDFLPEPEGNSAFYNPD